MFLGFCPAGLINTARGVRSRKAHSNMHAATVQQPITVPGESAVLGPQVLWPSAARLALDAAS